MASIAKYQRVKVIGQGSYGRAILVKDKNSNLFVIKEVLTLEWRDWFGRSQAWLLSSRQVDLSSKESQREEALKEVQFLSVLCQHPNIVELKEWFEDRAAKKLFIVMRYCDAGDLSSKVSKRKGVHFSEATVLHYFVQICLGLKHIHDRKILYRYMLS